MDSLIHIENVHPSIYNGLHLGESICYRYGITLNIDGYNTLYKMGSPHAIWSVVYNYILMGITLSIFMRLSIFME